MAININRDVFPEIKGPLKRNKPLTLSTYAETMAKVS